MIKLLALAGLMVLGGSLALASCGSETTSSPSTSTGQISPYAYTNPMKSEGSSPARLAGDGLYFGYVRSVAAKSHPPTVSFDVSQFFFGKDVQRAAEEDGAVAPGEPVANDHYERNPDDRSQVLELASDARVSAAPPASFLMQHISRRVQAECVEKAAREGAYCTHVPMSQPAFFSATRQLGDRYGFPVWVTIRDGRVVRIDEQYFP